MAVIVTAALLVWRNMIFISLIITVLLVGADQYIKYWAETNLVPGTTQSVIKIGDTEIFNLTYCENRGAAFSFLSGRQTLLIAITIVALIAITVFVLRSKSKSKLLFTAYTLIISGGIGNLIDRVSQGYVIDYIEFRMFHFAIFNFADICVVIGGILMVLYVFISERKAMLNSKGETDG